MTLTFTQQRLLAWTGVALAVTLVIWGLGPVLTPFVVASGLAYALTPLVDALHNRTGRRLPRVVWVVLVELAFLALTLALLLMVVPIFARELPLIRDQLPQLATSAQNWARPLLAQLGVKMNWDIGALRGMLLKYVNGNGEDVLISLLGSLKLGGSVAFAVFGNAVLIPVALFYLLLDWHGFVHRLLEWLPPRLRPTLDRFAGEVDVVLGQYLRGQLLVMFLLALYYSAGLALFGLDLALPIGVFTGMAVFVPYVGFGLGLLMAVLAGMLQFAPTGEAAHAWLMVAIVYGGGQVLEGFFLTPRLVGERIGLHPLAVIFALLAFGQVLGFVGVLLALPLSAVLLVALRRMRASYLDSRLYRG